MKEKSVIIEVCCSSAKGAAIAAEAGADRVELNSALYFGGLTPSIGEIEAARESCRAKLIAMIRPRAGGFCYDSTELTVIRRDIRAMINAGVDGFAFGCLSKSGEVDEYACKTVLEAIGGRESVFHRAFDMLQGGWQRALDTLMALSVTRVLTSGHAATAVLGASRLRDMVHHASGAIQILACGKIRPDNAALIVRQTGCRQLHLAAMERLRDGSSNLNPAIRFIGGSEPDQSAYEGTSAQIVYDMVESVKDIL